MLRFINVALFLFAILVFLAGCEEAEPVSREEHGLVEFDCGNGIRYPTSEEDFWNLYAGRGFGASGNHLGHDIAYEEGTPIYSIACGTVVFYGYANSYGTLLVAIEHTLVRPMIVRNGAGEEVSIATFLSIHGHQRPTSGRGGAGRHTGLHVGSRVTTSTIISYVENHEYPDGSSADLNGHGAEHDHFGIRLQSAADAFSTDGTRWLRGYDGAPSRRRYFADPADFMARLRLANGDVRWHPPGSFLVNRENTHESYLVLSEDTIVRVDHGFRILERLDRRAVMASRAEIGCYQQVVWTLPVYEGLALGRFVRFDGDPAVYELHEIGDRRYRFTHISWEAFVSWGLSAGEIERRPSSERDSTLARYSDRGFRRLSPGSLVRARDASEVAVVTWDERLPIFSWETFVAMGYDATRIFVVEPEVLDAVAGRRGSVITPELAMLCRVPSCSRGRCDGAGSAGGGGIDPPDAGAFVFEPADAGVSSPMADCYADRDCPGYGSGWRCRSGTCLETDIDGDGYLGSEGDCHFEAARIHPGAEETCDSLDDDCDGSIDETFDLSSDPSNCGSCGRTCPSGECRDGMCVSPPPPDDPPPSTDPNLVRIRLADSVRAQCPAGWRIRLWLDTSPEESPRGGDLERAVTRSGGHSSITLWCDERSPPWMPFDPTSVHALGTGIFAELSMDGVDLRSSTMLCEDPCAPAASGLRPIIRWDVAVRGTCPTSC